MERIKFFDKKTALMGRKEDRRNNFSGFLDPDFFFEPFDPGFQMNIFRLKRAIQFGLNQDETFVNFGNISFQGQFYCSKILFGRCIIKTLGYSPGDLVQFFIKIFFG